MTTITCKIPRQLDALLAAEARKKRVSKSEIVRQAIQERVKRRGGKPAPRAIDLVRHIAGTVKGGPRDLSSNPKYLEDLGA
jgi:hypothetical protein